jgi:hypothetical protein
MSQELVKQDHFHLGVLGRTGSGKTHWLKAFLRDKANVNVYIFCSEMSIASWRKFKRHNKQVKRVTSEIEHAIKLKEDLIKVKNSDAGLELPTSFVIFDDFMPIVRHMDARQAKELELLAKVGRHLKIRIIALAQDAKDCPKYLRTQFTHMGIMKGVDGETFNQTIQMLKLDDYNKKLWRDLTNASDHSMMLLEKGSNRGVFERAEDGKIVNNVKIKGNNNEVKVVNVQGKTTVDARRTEIINNRIIMLEQSKNRELDDAIERAKNIRNVFEGTYIVDDYINKCEHNISMLCSFLDVPVKGDDWIARAAYTLGHWRKYVRKLEGNPMSQKEELEMLRSLFRQIKERRKSLAEKLAVSYATSGQTERAVAHLVGNYWQKDKVMGMPLDRALDVGKVALSLVKKFR